MMSDDIMLAVSNGEDFKRKIVKNKEFVEIYNVYNDITNNYEDLLLVKSIKEARYLEKLFKDKDEIKHFEERQMELLYLKNKVYIKK